VNRNPNKKEKKNSISLLFYLSFLSCCRRRSPGAPPNTLLPIFVGAGWDAYGVASFHWWAPRPAMVVIALAEACDRSGKGQHRGAWRWASAERPHRDEERQCEDGLPQRRMRVQSQWQGTKVLTRRK